MMFSYDLLYKLPFLFDYSITDLQYQQKQMQILIKGKQCQRCMFVDSIVRTNELLVHQQIKLIKVIQAQKEKLQNDHLQLQAKFLELAARLKQAEKHKTTLESKQKQTQLPILQSKSENAKNIQSKSTSKDKEEGKSLTNKRPRSMIINKENIDELIPIVMMRKDEQYFSRKRKNSFEEENLTKEWVKTIDSLGLVTNLRFKQKTLPLVKKAIPHQLRHIIWPIVVENHLALTDELYFQLLQRRASNWVPEQVQSQISKDICRSFSGRTQYESRLGLKQDVTEVLELFHLYRPDVSYVQGMTYPVIVLTLVSGKVKAFNIFSNLILTNPFFKKLFTFQPSFVLIVARTFDHLLLEYNEEVANNLKMKNIDSQTFLVQWFFTLFSRSLSFQSTLKFWDYFLYVGETALFRLALAIIDLVGNRIMDTNYQETIGLIQGFGGFGRQYKLIESVSQNKLTSEKLHKTFEKFQKMVERGQSLA